MIVALALTRWRRRQETEEASREDQHRDRAAETPGNVRRQLGPAELASPTGNAGPHQRASFFLRASARQGQKSKRRGEAATTVVLTTKTGDGMLLGLYKGISYGVVNFYT
ncbi:hypothetical protein BDW59DRAFT_168220 [Aspergillus cavernicola]|uniref:Uncharacterized protein n=1 Tax=Aspergillus cavernicola TaxID=176166 RepID=A0ABR4H2X9_9EURO